MVTRARALLNQIHKALTRPQARVKVEITCPHGEFIPGAYTPGRPPSRYACHRCNVLVRVSTFQGEVTW